MESLNKFKIITIIVLCLFVFAVAAMYSNTKDASEGKMQLKSEEQQEQMQENIQTDQSNVTQNSDRLADIETDLSNLNMRVDELNEKVNNGSSSGTGLNCRIIGSMTDTGIEQLSPEAAVEEAKVNNREIVISCSLQ